MPTSGDLVDLDLGAPAGREAGFLHPAVVVTAQRILDADPSVIQDGIDGTSAPQCQHVRAVSPARISAVRGNVGATVLAQVRGSGWNPQVSYD